MKYFGSLLLAMSFLFLISLDSPAQKSNKKDEQFQEIVKLIESGQYVFEVQNIQPTGGKTIRSTSIYQMQVDGSIFQADLPYFGRAYQASYDGNLGVTFNARAEDLKMTKNEKKRSIALSFDIQGENDRYSVNFSVGYSGYGTLSVTSMKRQPITYTGIVIPPKEK